MSWLSPLLTIAASLFLCLTSIKCESALSEANGASYSTSTSLTLFLTFASLFFFVLAKLSGPGFLPRGWRPADLRERAALERCPWCDGYKAPRAHHCTRCGRCVKRMDHHCPFLNCCVGYENHSSFVYLVFFGAAAILHGLLPIVAAMAAYAGLPGLAAAVGYPGPGGAGPKSLPMEGAGVIMAFVSTIMALLMLLFVSLLIYYQVRGLVNNETLVERMTRDYAARRGRPFPNPYYIDPCNNVLQVFNCNGSRYMDRTGVVGTRYPTRPGADRTSFTRETRMRRAERQRHLISKHHAG